MNSDISDAPTGSSAALSARGSHAAARITSVDALRGLAIIGMILVGNAKEAWNQLEHGGWSNPTLADLVYPAFLITVGISLWLSDQTRQAQGVSFITTFSRIGWRALKLFFIGLFLLSVSYSQPRFNTGTLQCIAVATVLSAPLLRSPSRSLVFVIAAIHLVYLFVMQGVRAPDVPWEERWAEGRTLAEFIDTVLLSKPKGEEGILPTAIAWTYAILGILIGRLFTPNVRTDSVVKTLILLSGGAILLAMILSTPSAYGTWYYIPLAPRLLSPSYFLLSSGFVVLALAFLHAIPAHPAGQRVLWPLHVFGQNALAVYIFMRLFRKWILLTWTIETGSGRITLKDWLMTSFSACCGSAAATYLYTASIITISWLFCYWLWIRGIRIRL